jgi:hypothetical protein
MSNIPEEVIEKYRDINVEHEWWEFVYEDFTERMNQVGIHVSNMMFSGFWSQGDGACFEGWVDDPDLFMLKHDLDGHYPYTYKSIEHNGCLTVSSSHAHRHCHENSVTISVETDTFDCLLGYDTDTEIQQAVIDVLDQKLSDEFPDFEQSCTEIFRDYMCELYASLHKEYDYLTSDEAVIEAIEANELYTPKVA